MDKPPCIFKPLTIIGSMSGTSLDGLDIALCDFWKEKEAFLYKFIQTQTFSYPKELAQKLRQIFDGNALFLCQVEVEFSNFMAQCINQFIKETDKKPDYIASHGHTVFHQPEKGLTKQIGSGAILAAKTGISTVCDFRTADVALGGQGAPLVPIGDMSLFSEYDGCLNLGGISNISLNKQGTPIAYDISLCNILINYLAEQRGLPYDKKGALAKTGEIHNDLFDALNQPDFFSLNSAKTIGFEFFTKYYQPLLESFSISVEDKLRTVCEHIAMQIAANLKDLPKILVTGGGAKNDFLIHILKEKTNTQIIIPDEQLVDFKEALIFAFLGYLRVHEAHNCLRSVTGALKDSCSGAVYGK
jgi:anhydro-N-acetylmuramic acid kinase